MWQPNINLKSNPINELEGLLFMSKALYNNKLSLMIREIIWFFLIYN